MNTNPTEVNPARFRQSLAMSYARAELLGAPLCPLSGERRTIGGRTYAVRETECGGFKVESGSAKWNVTFTDLATGRSWTVMGARAKTRRAKDGTVRHRYSHPSVGSHGTWADLITALLTQQQAQAVAA